MNWLAEILKRRYPETTIHVGEDGRWIYVVGLKSDADKARLATDPRLRALDASDTGRVLHDLAVQPRSLEELLELLPDMTEDGLYCELRKHTTWVAALVDWHTNGERCNRIGNTPVEAVFKLLEALETLHV